MNDLAEELGKVLQTDPLVAIEIVSLPSSEKGILGLLEKEEAAISPKESITADTSNNTQATSETIDTSKETTSVSNASPKQEETNTPENSPSEISTTDFTNESTNESMQELQALNSGELYFALAMGQAIDSDKILEIANWQLVFGTGEDSSILYHNVHNG
ncbi:hypothetical protein [Synechococcus sp.]